MAKQHRQETVTLPTLSDCFARIDGDAVDAEIVRSCFRLKNTRQSLMSTERELARAAATGSVFELVGE